MEWVWLEFYPVGRGRTAGFRERTTVSCLPFYLNVHQRDLLFLESLFFKGRGVYLGQFEAETHDRTKQKRQLALSKGGKRR